MSFGFLLREFNVNIVEENAYKIRCVLNIAYNDKTLRHRDILETIWAARSYNYIGIEFILFTGSCAFAGGAFSHNKSQAHGLRLSIWKL